MAGRKIDYLFLRPGSRNWHLKLQYPGELAKLTGQKRIEKSLGTPDRAIAEIMALPLIREHKLRLHQAMQKIHFGGELKHQFEPGREHVAPDGSRVIATKNELLYLDANGAIIKTAVNATSVLQFQIAIPSIEGQRAFVRRENAQRRSVNDRTQDGIIETYLSHANVSGYNAREARSTWETYKKLTQNKPLKDATRDDGRKVVQFFADQGIKSATIKKKIGWLSAAVNLAIDESRLQFNPFSKIVPKLNDEEARLPLSDADIKNARQTLGLLSEHDQLLFRLLASTGMRLAEAFEIETELRERGCRYVIVGTKTPQSKRRIPLPSAVLPYVSKEIQRPLFQGGPHSASKRLNSFLNAIGITDTRKVVHSLRHRAQDRLRAAGCPIDHRWALLGHEKKSVAEGYGSGFPVPLLKRWIDTIGF